MIRASVDTSAIDRVFHQIENRVNDLRQPLNAAGASALDEFKQRFQQQGPGWAPNSGANPVGHKTGDLERSYTQRGATGNEYVVTPDGASFGSHLPYAKDFQEGGEITQPGGRKVTLPARPVVRPPGIAVQTTLGERVKHHLTDGIQ